MKRRKYLFADGGSVKEAYFIGVGVNGNDITFVIHKTTNIRILYYMTSFLY